MCHFIYGTRATSEFGIQWGSGVQSLVEARDSCIITHSLVAVNLSSSFPRKWVANMEPGDSGSGAALVELAHLDLQHLFSDRVKR